MVPVVETGTIREINITQAVRDGKALLASNRSQESLTEFARDTVQNLVEAVTMLSNRLSLDSSNSSIPASKELPHKKHAKRKETQSAGVKRKPGGQEGHPGTNLKKVDNPDFIEKIHIDRRTIPRGFYETLEFETRQVFDIQISLVVTEYQAEVIQDQQGNQYIATFPEGVSRPAQYGNDTKASSVYLSQYQLVPLERIKDYFQDQAGIDISKGSVANFNVEASKRLDGFIEWVSKKLVDSEVNHGDETSINVSGKTLWLHSLSNDKLTLFHADTKRGQEAMDRMGVLPHFKGVLCHDHWKAYFKYPCKHSLCNGCNRLGFF